LASATETRALTAREVRPYDRSVGRCLLLVLAASCAFDPKSSPGTSGDAAPLPIDAAPDAAAPDARICPAAPAGCEAFTCAGSTSCYYRCAARSWEDARDRCAGDAIGCLVTIDNAAEDQCVFANTAPAFPDLVWVGYRQSGGGGVAANWGWECGTSPYVAPNWGQFEPNDSDNAEDGDEDCASIGQNNAWIDIDCGDSKRYVCELP
jgi:hypothetical protein